LKSSSLTTLLHMEPSPRALKLVPQLLLPLYGWKHEKAGIEYPENEMSFRQTISAAGRSDRGFTVKIDKKEKKVLISFDSTHVASKHSIWLSEVEKRIGLTELNPQPYWGFDDLFHKAGTKLINCFFVQASVKKEKGIEYFKYDKILMLQKFSIDKFLDALNNNDVLVDFDARTGHNHGTKFRLRQNKLPSLYETVTEL
ncbi:MAG: MvaI/BcnI restriction endonuclease family protein, partial [Melioribacteraceae bacterium]